LITLKDKFWNTSIKQIKPYTPGEQPSAGEYIKLNTNENPYPPSPKVLEAISGANNAGLRLYPDPDCQKLKESIAKYKNLQENQIFVGNGSDEVLALVFLALLGNGKKVLFPDITYSFYPVYCELFNIFYEAIPLNEDFSIPLDAFSKENGGVIICNPNAPTGKLLSVDSIRKILALSKENVVVIDEAYIDFGGESAVPLIEEFENLLVVQTLSKSRALAGLRVGFAMGSSNLIEGLNTVKNSFNSYTLDRLSIVGGCAAIEDVAYFNTITSKVVATRTRSIKELEILGFEVIDSKANFVFVKHAAFKAVEIYEYLKKNKILVRYFNKPRIDDYLRISIGTDEQMEALIDRLKKYSEENEVKEWIS
jgi:histidinol-phosphate aminotransferase